MTRVRVNGPMAAIVIAFMVIVAGVWTALVILKIIEVDSLRSLAGWVVGVVMGGSVPVATLWKEKKLTLETDSDPPSKGPPDDS